MDWKAKMLGEKVCSLLPFGYELASIVRRKFTNPTETTWDPSRRIDVGLENLALLKAVASFDAEGKTILEVGTGRTGIDLLIFYVLGAEAIYTFDHVLHLEKEAMTSAILPLRNRLDSMSDKFEIAKDKLLSRIEKISVNGSLQSMLSSCNAKAFKYPITNANLKSGSVDLFYSESVLQRMPDKRLSAVLKTASALLSDAGVSFHTVHTNDINSMKYYDANLWPLEYLKYSDFWWNLMCSEEFNSQNRLREPQFVDLLRQVAEHALYVESYRHKGDVERLKGFPLAKRFQNIPLEEVAVLAARICNTKQYISDTRKEISFDKWRRWM